MRSQPKLYSGYKITDDVIKRVKDIIKLREPQAYDSVWKNIDTLEDLCLCDGAEVAEENIVLGEDWFISYIIDGCISIENWIALDDNENKLVRLGEMFAEIKNILLLSNELDTDIVCYMRHNTSYQFYLKYKKMGYFDEMYTECYISNLKPKEMDSIINKLELENKLYTIDDEMIVHEDVADSYPEYNKYFMHDVAFSLTKKFIDRYKKRKN